MPNEEKLILSPYQIGDLTKDGKQGKVSDATFDRILAETGGKAVIVIALPSAIISNMPIEAILVKSFHISAINVQVSLLPLVFNLLTQALVGKVPGTTITTKSELL